VVTRFLTTATSVWFFLEVVVPLALAVWVLIDVRHSQRRQQRKLRLQLDGKWDELDAHFQRELKSRRLLSYIMRKYVLPGNLQASYALFLYQRGQLETALEFADRSVALARKQRVFLKSVFGVQQKILPSALNSRVLILTGLGRYDDARVASAELRNMPSVRNKAQATICLTEVYLGNLDRALELAYETLAQDPKDGTARVVASWVFRLKGEFAEAINILVYKPKDVTELYSQKDLDTLLRDRESAKFIALQRQHAATIYEPIRLLVMSGVYLDQADYDDATHALDAMQSLLGNNPVIRSNYERNRAICSASKGDVRQAEQHLAEARTIALNLPKRDTQWETNISAGRCYLLLKLTDKASNEFLAAQRRMFHPIEKHMTNYWLARTMEVAKHRAEAIRNYQCVVADDIPTVMRQESLDALDRLT